MIGLSEIGNYQLFFFSLGVQVLEYSVILVDLYVALTELLAFVSELKPNRRRVGSSTVENLINP